MILNTDDFKTMEAFSNHMVVAMGVESCPLKRFCFRMAIGFGTILEQCDNLRIDESAGVIECDHRPDTTGESAGENIF